MLRVDLAPSVVVRFHPLEHSDVFATLSDAMYLVLMDLTRKAAVTMVKMAGMAVAWQGMKVVLGESVQVLSMSMIAGATFWSAEALAMTYGGKHSALITNGEYVPAPAPQDDEDSVPSVTPRLPRLSAKISVPVVPSERPCKEQQKMSGSNVSVVKKAAPQPKPVTPTLPTLSPLRRRILDQLHAAPTGVNVVRTERRRRADQALFQSKIRVGKAWLDPTAPRGSNGKRRRQDMYMVRVDCGREDDKHMNPVVMWDVTATYEEFRHLEKALRQEVKTKQLRNVHVPHLSSGAILFVQEELNDNVLAARRTRLQTFLDGIATDAVLADLMATRKFFQVC